MVTKIIMNKYKGIFNQNIPKIKDQMRMNRKEVVMHFSRFLAMLWDKAITHKEQFTKNPEEILRGVDQKMFKHCLPQLLMED